MVTRRSKHAGHLKTSASAKRRANRRGAAPSVGNLAGLGSSGTNGRQSDAPSVGNLAGLDGSGTSRHARNASSNGRGVPQRAAHSSSATSSGRSASQRGSAAGSGSSDDGVRIPTPNGGEVLLTRRHFLYGALGVGALAAVGGGASVIIQQAQNDSDDVTVLEVPESAVATSEDCTALEDASSSMSLVGNFELPYGTLVWANDDAVAACLIPTENANPLTQVGFLALNTGNCPIVLEQAVGASEGFEIYDVRATSSGLIWTEADILDGVWRIYTARSNGASVENPTLVDEGNGDWETPAIAAVGTRAFWQVLPKTGGPHSTEDSLLKGATMGSSEVQTVFTSHGRMSTPPYALADSVVITPRTDTSTVHYQLTRLDANSGQVLDTMALPTSMRPLEAGYGENGFMFSFEAIYSYGGGIANLGTYTPAATVTDGNYSDAPWFRFNATPTAAPAWCGPYLMVKSRYAVCGVDLEAMQYFTFEVPDGADDYGEYLASTGTRNTVVTYTNMDDNPVNGEAKTCCLVRVWSPIA